MPGMKTALKTVCTQDETDRTIRRLRFVARIRAIHGIFQECVKTLPSFSQLTITPIPTPSDQASTRVNISQARTTARKSLQQWSVPVPKWFKENKLVHDVAEDYGRKLITHAEIQMVFFFAARKPKLFPHPYLGISKKTCYMCNVFLSQLKRFRTRPSHGQLHPRWTLPRMLDLDREDSFALVMALKAVKQSLAEILRRPTASFLPFRPESTTVWSSKPSIRSGTASVISSHFPLPQLGLSPFHEQRKIVTTEWNAARLPMITKPTEEVGDAGSKSSDMVESYWRQTLQERFNTLVSLLMGHFDNLPNAVQEELSSLDLDFDFH